MRFFGVIITFFHIFLPSAAAQDRLSAEEILQWFPLGSYERVIHYDLEKMQMAKAYTVVEKLFRHLTGEYETRNLPEPFRRELRSFTTATLLKLGRSKKVTVKEMISMEELVMKIEKITKSMKKAEKSTRPSAESREHRQSARIEKKERRRPTSTLTFSIEGKRVRLVNFGSKLRVFRYDDLDTLIKNAIKDGIIADTGILAEGRPIYSLHGREGRAKNYIYATATGELLMAERVVHLKKMIATGFGLDLSILDELEYVDLIQMIPELGQYWHYWYFRNQLKRALVEMRKAEVDEGTVSQFEERMETGLQFTIDSYSVEDQIVRKQLELYGNEETARKSEDRKKNGGPRGSAQRISVASTDHDQLLKKARQVERNGNLITVTTVYDEKLIESTRAATEVRKELLKKVQQQSKALKKYFKMKEDKP